MKIGVKLHHHKSKGPIDTYHSTRSPFSADYRQACRILQAIRLYNDRPSQACIAHLATFVTKSWESDSSTEKVNDICEYMNHLLETTTFNHDHLSLDESIQQYCSKNVALPTVCPSITLLFAVRYIERLKQSYGNVKGTQGCSRRLILVAYIIAAKYIHSNLKFIVDTNLPPLKKETSNPASASSSSSSSSSSSLSSSSTTSTSTPTSSSSRATKSIIPSTEQNSHQLTLHPGELLSTPLPVSPPVSPKQPELTNPTQYHFFQSTKPSTFSDQVAENNTHIASSSTRTDSSMPSISSLCSQFNYRVWRMENEFLHFLNGDITVSDCLRLVDWANKISSPLSNNDPTS